MHQMVRCYHPHPHWTPLPTCSTQHWPQTAPFSPSLLPPLQVPPCIGLVSCQSPSHASRQGVRGRSAVLLHDSGTHHPLLPSVLRFLSLLCQFYPCYNFAVLSFFLFWSMFSMLCDLECPGRHLKWNTLLLSSSKQKQLLQFQVSI